jgi:hypothetical protein
MNKRILPTAFYILILLLSPLILFSQGCSDAGFCTMGAMRPNQQFNRKLSPKLRSVELSQYAGINDLHDVIMAYTADVNIGLSSKYTVQVKIPYMVVLGKLANTNGLGDISLSATRNLIAKEKYQLNFTLGTKIPPNNGNITTERNNKTVPLPNYYQTSLGTYDIIAGISLITKKWLIATGYQQALNSNGNQFLWGPWNRSGSPDSLIAQKYPVCKDLHRGKDIMLRVERNFRLARFNAHIGLLGIYRITEDEFTNKFNQRQKMPGTTGLALTGVTGIGYNFSARSAIKVTFGARLVERYRAEALHGLGLDGLSRQFVNTIGYEFRF